MVINMIYIERSEIGRYYGMSKNLDTALKMLENTDLSQLVQGKNIVDGEEVFVNRFDYTTIDESEAFFEAHELYADVHVLLSGEEKIACADIKALRETDRDPESDFVGYKGKSEVQFVMNTSKLLIVFPTEAHMVKIKLNTPCTVEKAVIKVKINN